MADFTKYVVVDDAIESMVIFSAALSHAFFRPVGRIISAGFIRACSKSPLGFRTEGESISLGLVSRPEDQILLDILLTKQPSY